MHVLNLVGLRNRLQVVLSWLYNYLTYDRGPRLIFPREYGPNPARLCLKRRRAHCAVEGAPALP